jgi:RHS repeat-associated protein
MNTWLLYIAMVLLTLPVFGAVALGDVSLVNQYDPSGNMISGDGKYYEYNDANQLLRVRTGNQYGAIISEYFYDHNGQRIKKVDYDTTGKKTTTYYIGNYYETQVADGQVANTTYTTNTSYFLAGRERVAKKDATGTYFYHPDHLGGVNVVTDSKRAVVATTSYLPFGEVLQGGAEKISYTGKEKDKSTDMYYFDARYNDPNLRHFTQPDTVEPDLEDPQELNKYIYVGNNPITYVDPDGHRRKKKQEIKLSKNEKKILKEAKKVAKNSKGYEDYKANCKMFANEIVKKATGKNLPPGYSYADKELDKAKSGDVLQYGGKIKLGDDGHALYDEDGTPQYEILPHTAIVLKSSKKYLTVLDANYPSSGIRKRTVLRSTMENYEVYRVPN